jgi:uncharacterized PurR-regulated membrane protein YhhQ (DUF165 family)
MTRRLTIAALVGLYLSAIVAANLLVTHFGPRAAPYVAFGLVAFDLVSRDRLHDLWGSRRWLGMAMLIVAGSLISYLLNQDAQTVAIASAVAFALSLAADAIVYELAERRGWPWLARSNASNIVGGAVDSAVFVLLAFPGFLAGIAFGQWTAKVAGGLIIAWLLAPKPARTIGIMREGHVVEVLGDGAVRVRTP